MAAMHKERPKAIVADPQRIICECLAHVLSKRFDIVRMVQTGPALYLAIHECKPAVVVLDASMAECTGLQVLRRLKEEGFPATYVVISEHDSVAVASAALKSGASAFVPKHRSSETLLEAMSQSLSGRPYVALSTFRRLANNDYGRFQKLTDRQRSVLRLILAGKTSKRIGQELGISHRTVESHKYTIMKIFNAEATMTLLQCIKPFEEELYGSEGSLGRAVEMA
ncbi:response regulator transcription factor [Dyella japonica]|uniref:LuxR family transcriptional regulator n=1 Tax=Dyella japonica A8 TaxID=1217721 RepID=A0A075JYM4_9GAMM|nr:response regulator transcription factor [Dyella japonica]AIF46695.1 hypothetical protein HY57_05170 [Dyella japonica A8]